MKEYLINSISKMNQLLKAGIVLTNEDYKIENLKSIYENLADQCISLGL